MTIETDQSTNRQWGEDVSPLTDVREYDMSGRADPTPGPWEQGDEHFDGGGSWVAIDGPDSEDIAWVRCEQGNQSNAHLIAASRDMYEALEATTRELIGERDCLYESISLPDGSIPDGEDQAGLAEMDRVIDQARSAIKKARGDSHE